MKKVDIAGVRFDAVDFRQAVSIVEEFIRQGIPRQVVTANVDFVVKASRDLCFRDLINSSDLVVADGMPVIWASRILGTPLPERVAGLDLALKLCGRSGGAGFGIYLLGGSDDARAKAAERLRQGFPGIRIAGSYSPPFGGFSAGEEARIEESMRSSGAHVVFVCLGAGRQERWIRDHMGRSGAAVFIGMGSFIDFVAGEFVRAPRWAQRLGLEWLFRLIQDPARLFKRYIIDDTRFFFLVVGQKFMRARTKNRKES